MNLDRRILWQGRKVQVTLALAILAGLLAGLAAVFQARQLSQIITGVLLESQGLAESISLIWGLLAIFIARGMLGFLGESAAASAAIRVKAHLRETLTMKLLALGPAFTQGEKSGELVNNAMQGIEALDGYFSQYLPQLVLAGLLPLAYLIVVLPLDPLSGLVLMFTGPLIPFFMFLIGHNAQTLTHHQWQALGRMSAYFLDTLQGLATLKALGRSRDQVDRIARISEHYRETTMSVLRITFLSALALELLGTIGVAIIAVQVGLRLLYGQIAFEQAFFVLILAPEFYLPLRSLGLRFHASMAGISAAQRIHEVLDQPDLIRSVSSPASNDFALQKPFAIQFSKVTFTYPGRSQPALADFDLHLRSGEMTALVGPSGAGKSTVAQLLLRFIDPDQGQVWINDMPLTELPLALWREQIAWVPQRPYLFQGTIADNLRIAQPQASDAEITVALEQAHLIEFIEQLSYGLDTQIGEGGMRLSSGQAQRLVLARAFLREAPLLVLDEPTAHLDVAQEFLLQKTTRQLMAGRTALVIAHRLSTVMHAGQVVLLDDGRVIEAGKPSDLIHQKGRFFDLLADYVDEARSP